MSKAIDNKPVEALVMDLVQGVEDVNDLNLAKANHREAFLKALEKRPALLTKVAPINEEHFFKYAIEKNYQYFVQLDRKQYTDELAQIYLFKRLTDEDPKAKKISQGNYEITIQKSMSEKTLFNFFYVTPEGEELYYLDKELQVPLSLKSNIQLSLKLTNAVALIDKLDTHITQLGEQKIKSVIADLIVNNYKSYLNSYIQDKGIGYYTLCTSLSDVEAGFKKMLGAIMAPYGISINDVVVKKIAIPKEIQNKLEDQALKLRQRRVDVEADVEFSKLSLEGYEAKLAIQSKYPDAELTLTEYEKDLALKRYLTKLGRVHEESVDRSIAISGKVVAKDAEVDKKEDIVPEIPAKVNVFKRLFFTFFIIFTSIALISMAADVGVGLITLGVDILVFGIIAGCNYSKFKTEDVEADATALDPGATTAGTPTP